MLAPDTLLINRYRIVRKLGQGGMGTVYEAVDVELNCPVAVKETFAEWDEHRRLFKREASLLANLRHPALPKVTNHFTLKRGQYLVMEFIPGIDLMQMIQERGSPFHPADVLQWSDVVLDALHYLHRREPHPVIHRDIKPANLKITTEGDVILLDFGLAKGRVGDMSSVHQISSLGYTPGYAPLEQMLQADTRWRDFLKRINEAEVQRFLGEPTDARSDLFSLGATIYHLLTNAFPADAASRAMSVWSGEADPLRPPNLLNPHVTPSVVVFLARAMAIERADRFASAAEMRMALREAAQDPLAHPKLTFNGGETVVDMPPPPRLAADPAGPTWPQLGTEPMRTNPVYRADSSTKPTLPLLKYGLLGSCGSAVRSVSFSPDGKKVASGSNDGAVRVWDTQGGAERVLGNCGDGGGRRVHVSAVAFSPDGLRVSSGSSGGRLHLWDAVAGGGRVVLSFPHQVRSLAYSSAGGLAVGCDDGSVLIVQHFNNQSRPVERCDGIVWGLAFARDGKRLAAESDDHTIRVWDVNESYDSPSPTLFVWDVTVELVATLNSPDEDLRSLDFSPDGQQIVAAGRDRHIRLWELGAQSERVLGECGDVVRSVAFSPDGRKVATASDDGAVRMWDVRTGVVETLGHCDDVASCVAFSPDGRALVSGSWDGAIRLWQPPL